VEPFASSTNWWNAPVETGSGEKPNFTTEAVDGVELRLLSAPYFSSPDGLYGGKTTATTPRASVDRTVDLLQRHLTWGAGVGISGAAIDGWLLAGRAPHPIDRITATAASIATSGDRAVGLSARLDEPDANDEVSRLARTFNAMLDRLEAAFVDQGRFLADAAHELRTTAGRSRSKTSSGEGSTFLVTLPRA